MPKHQQKGKDMEVDISSTRNGHDARKANEGMVLMLERKSCLCPNADINEKVWKLKKTQSKRWPGCQKQQMKKWSQC